ncbi:MAG: stage III sporulation protein AD [Clostridia bacterium]|nr:stage III sporulation protein AD [Clostridia bacterium]
MSEDIFKILAVLLVAAVMSLILKQKNSEYALFVAISAGVVTALLILKNISTPIAELKSQIEAYGVETEYFKVAVKALGIGYITSFIADACRDSGQTSLAAKAELAGKAAIFIMSLPLLMSVLEIAVGFIK